MCVSPYMFAFRYMTADPNASMPTCVHSENSICTYKKKKKKKIKLPCSWFPLNRVTTTHRAVAKHVDPTGQVGRLPRDDGEVGRGVGEVGLRPTQPPAVRRHALVSCGNGGNKDESDANEEEDNGVNSENKIISMMVTILMLMVIILMMLLVIIITIIIIIIVIKIIILTILIL